MAKVKIPGGLTISPSKRPSDWKNFEQLRKNSGLLKICPYFHGKSTPDAGKESTGIIDHPVS